MLGGLIVKTEKVEYERQIAVAEKQIVELEALHVKLEEQRGCLNIDQLSEAKRIRMEQDEIHGKISDLKLLRDLAREQIVKWEKNAPEAGKLVKVVATVYDKTRAIVADNFIPSQERVGDGLQKLEVLNNEIGTAEGKYKELTGESMEAPGRVVVYQALGFAGSNVERVKPWPAWTFISETQRRAAYAEELEKKLEGHEARAKIAGQSAPPCPICGTKMVVDRRSGRSDTPGESLYHGQWNFRCPKCGATQTVPIPETK
jgi:hypothetical protein